MHSELLAPLIDTTYAATLEPTAWHRVMQLLTDMLGASCSTIVIAEGDALLFQAHDERLPAEAIADYVQNFFGADTVRAAGTSSPPGIPQTEEDILSEATEKVYNEFYIRWDWCHILGMCLLQQGRCAGTVSVYRSAKCRAFSDDDRRVLMHVGHHLCRSLQIQQKLAAATDERAVVLDAIDQLTVGVVFVDDRGRVVLMNRSACEMTAQRDGLANERGELVASTPSATRAIRDIIASTLRESFEVRVRPTLTITRPSRRRPYILLVSPIRSTPGFGVSSRAVILISDTDREMPAAADALRAIYGFSPAEASLAIALCDGRTTKEVALDRNVAPSTVHTQLASIQRKMGASRQAEIVSVLMRGPLSVMRLKRP